MDDEYKKDGDGFLRLIEYISEWGNRSVLILGMHNYDLMLKKYEYLKTKVSHIYDIRVNCVNGELVRWNKEDAKSKLADFKYIYDMLSDDKSRLVMELYLRAAVNGEFDALYKKCYEPTAYFNSITKNLPVDVLIDCGAFDGDSIGDFTKVFPNYKRIIALEPDEQNAIKLMDNMKKNRIENVDIIKKGVYSKTGVLKFCILGNDASFMSKDGDVEVPVIALDDILSDFDKSKVFMNWCYTLYLLLIKS